MASVVAKRSDHRASRSASWSVMHSDEELARILQMQEEKEYQDHLAAKEVQCQSDHRLARLLSEHGGHHDGGMDFDEFRETRRRQTRQSSRSATNSTNAAAGTSFQTAAALSITDSDTDFSDCFEDSTFDDLTSALERAQNEADCLAEQQDAADALTRNGEIAEALQNDEQLNRMVENELELSGSIGEPGNASFHPIVVSSSSPMNSASFGTGSDLSNRRNEPMEFSPVDLSNNDDWTSQNESAFSPGTSSANNSLLTSVNIAWNVVGSAVNWVSELFSGVQPPQASNVSNRVIAHAAGDAEEDDDDEEEEGCEEDDGWETEDSDDFGDFDEEEDDDDDEDRDFDIIESDMDESDDDNNEVLVGFGNAVVVGRGRGLVQSEIDVLPTRTYQSRPPQSTTTTMSGAADSGANEHQCHNECQVCLSSFADGEVLRTLPCCHQFHSECIDVWLQRNAICPVCRVRIRDEIGCR